MTGSTPTRKPVLRGTPVNARVGVWLGAAVTICFTTGLFSVFDRNYHAGLWISLAIVWARVPLYLVAMRLLPGRAKSE
jgi:hypothetical protein